MRQPITGPALNLSAKCGLYWRRYRFVIVRSNSLDARNENKLTDASDRAPKRFEKAVTDPSKILYGCVQDARGLQRRAARNTVQAIHGVKTTLEKTTAQAKWLRRGRPRQDESAPLVLTQYKIQVVLQRKL
jgi:hypothetical protein